MKQHNKQAVLLRLYLQYATTELSAQHCCLYVTSVASSKGSYCWYSPD